MTLPQVLVLALPTLLIGLAVLGKLRVDVAAMAIAIALGVLQLAGLGVLDPSGAPSAALRAFSGFSQPAVITLIGLFIITRSLDSTGITRWVARRILQIGGHSEARLVALLAGTTAVFSLLMNNVAAGALLLPGALETARRSGLKPSRLLMPVAFGSLLGGMATYFTTANIIASDLLHLANPPQPSLNMLHFLPTGGLIAVVGIVYLATFGRRLLPDRAGADDNRPTTATPGELETYYQLGERVWELQLKQESGLVGQTLAEAALGRRLGLTISAIWRGRQAIFAPQAGERLAAGDILQVVGRAERLEQLASLGLVPNPDARKAASPTRGATLAELVVAPHSPVIGKTLTQIAFREQTGVTVLALRRGERSYRTDVGQIPLAVGDTLLVTGSPARLKGLRRLPSFFSIEPDLGDQPLSLRKAWPAALITAAAITASVAGVPTALAVSIGALAIILLKIVPIDEAYQSMEWQIIFQVAGMVALSQAMVATGLSGLAAELITRVAAPLGPLGLAGGAFLLAAGLTQLMGGQVTALVVGPVTIAAALTQGVNAQAVAVATAIGCSASFLTPMAHPINILMMTPGSYNFGDFFRAGWPLLVLTFVMLLVGMALFWGL